MPRSRFEQLIDAGLASSQSVPAEPTGVRVSTRTWQMTIPPELVLSAGASGAARPHLSARELRRAYRDWLSLGDQGEPIADPPRKSGRDAGPRASSRPEPKLPELLAQLTDHSKLTRQQLQNLRRQLARRLHPDLATPEERRAATAEMARLNAMVDDALRARSR